MSAPRLARHFDRMERQVYAARLGIWTVPPSGMLFVTGLFALYAVHRRRTRA